MYALFVGDAQLSKAYSTKDAVLAEAMERGLVVRGMPDFESSGSNVTVSLQTGYSIRAIDKG